MKQNPTNGTGPRFQLGRLVITPAASAALEAIRMPEYRLLARHIQCDWGDITEEDRLQNDLALQEGSRLLSSYTLSNNVKVWIITEADRSITTLLLPEDY